MTAFIQLSENNCTQMHEEQIKKAEDNVKKRGLAKIVKHYNGFIIMAQSDRDYQSSEKFRQFLIENNYDGVIDNMS